MGMEFKIESLSLKDIPSEKTDRKLGMKDMDIGWNSYDSNKTVTNLDEDEEEEEDEEWEEFIDTQIKEAFIYIEELSSAPTLSNANVLDIIMGPFKPPYSYRLESIKKVVRLLMMPITRLPTQSSDLKSYLDTLISSKVHVILITFLQHSTRPGNKQLDEEIVEMIIGLLVRLIQPEGSQNLLQEFVIPMQVFDKILQIQSVVVQQNLVFLLLKFIPFLTSANLPPVTSLQTLLNNPETKLTTALAAVSLASTFPDFYHGNCEFLDSCVGIVDAEMLKINNC
eukprot:TRINITY_DN16879_c0_g1_i1.p1 TRINITY_DN16879_c0_g1~~TRINITY_DN16879_c0_g1_i1.p1  ORF type:complete len:317 (-),score=33.01 TRINITY_DN16879_c0_g1_i1:48-893(-)